jgi:predicted DNA-binding ribbon-helix-helix protein
VKTTLNLDNSLIIKAKAVAAKEHTTLTRLIEEGLKARLLLRRTKNVTTALPVYKGRGGLVQGVDGLSNAALREAAE